MDKSAMGHDFIAKVEKHGSQVDASKGFGGKFGVGEKTDKNAMGWDHLEKVEKHTSSKGSCLSYHVQLFICFVYIYFLSLSDYKDGFGGKFGVQTDRQDKSALGWDHIEKVDKHESQVDHKKGFGGKHGVGVQDKCAVGWEHHEKVDKHNSQVDHKKGFGGVNGVGVQDKSAVGWEHHEKVDKHESQKGCPSLFVFLLLCSCPCQITRPALEDSSESKLTAWTRAPWVGNITKRSRNTSPRKVSFAYLLCLSIHFCVKVHACPLTRLQDRVWWQIWGADIQSGRER